MPDQNVLPPTPTKLAGTGAVWRHIAAAAVVAGVPAAAQAGKFTAPAGVTDYRLLFETSTTIAGSSSDIATYNAFVTQQATLNPFLPKTTWEAIASTSSISAVTNVSCGAFCDGSVPIYLVDGSTLVASSGNAFFSTGQLLILKGAAFAPPPGFTAASFPVKTQNGSVAPTDYIWTGSNNDGTPDIVLGSGFPRAGYYNGTSADLYDGFQPSSSLYHVFALSGDIGPGGTSVPEPATAALLVGGLAVIGVFRRRRA